MTTPILSLSAALTLSLNPLPACPPPSFLSLTLCTAFPLHPPPYPPQPSGSSAAKTEGAPPGRKGSTLSSAESAKNHSSADSAMRSGQAPDAETLYSLVDPKSPERLEAMGGVDTIMKSLGTSSDTGRDLNRSEDLEERCVGAGRAIEKKEKRKKKEKPGRRAMDAPCPVLH